MKKNSNSKNYFTIAVIVLALFTGIFIQSCQTDDKDIDKIDTMTIKQNEKKKIAKKFQNIFLKKTENLIEITKKNDQLTKLKSSNKKEIANLKIVTINEIKSLTLESKNFLKQYNNLSDKDLHKISGGNNEECFIILSMAILAKEKEKQKVASNNDINLQSLITIQNANAEIEWHEVGNCAIAAIGADVLYALATSTASTWTVAAITSAFSTVAKRALGPIGVAIAVTAFGLCLVDAEVND